MPADPAWLPCGKTGRRLLLTGGSPAPPFTTTLKLPLWAEKIGIRLHTCNLFMAREAGGAVVLTLAGIRITWRAY